MSGARIRHGERVSLRTLEDEDRPFLQRAYANSEIRYPLGTPLKRRDDLEHWLVPEHHGKGYGREAVAPVVDYVFRTDDVPKAGATVYDFNDASRGLLESLGFVEEGRIRKDRFADGAYRDTIQYGLLREEWRDEHDG